MNVKINTKERFAVLIPQEPIITANMTGSLTQLADYAQQGIPHLVINMKEVKEMAPEAAHKLAALQQEFYERNQSFVICEFQEAVQNIFDREKLTDTLNFTPTESEACDIVQMEEIERELLGGD